MNQRFTGIVIKLPNLKTATVKLTSIKIHPKYHKPQKITKVKKAHYEITEEEIINWLVQFFQKSSIREISLKNEELVIENNDKKVARLEEMVSKQELYNIKNYLVKTKQNSLTAERLKELSNSNSSKKALPLQLGNKVIIESSRPLSKTKRFLVISKE
ncbi:MAG: hypothetical protein I3275_05425 [Candidatus Moeniiplasma glomeromycotorum]|nr:hypothetical protein [Candidatus Moeniiplasma glomeromycotorum]